MAATKRPQYVFSTTALGGWDSCETRAYYGDYNGLGLEHPILPVPLVLGNLIHYTFADWGALVASRDRTPVISVGGKVLQSRIGNVDPGAIFDRHFAAFKRVTYERYEAFYMNPMDDYEFEERFDTQVRELGSAMIANYVTMYGSPYPDDCTLLAPEQTIIRPVAKWRGERQRQLYIEGTFDQFLLDAQGRLLIRDFKTYEKAATDYELAANDQFMTYDWLAREEWPEYDVLGVVYDGLWKRTAPTKSKPEFEGLFKREYLLYSDEKIENHASRLPLRAYLAYTALQRRRRLGPTALRTVRNWSTCPGCMFQEPCMALTEGEFGEWTDDAEQEALADYVKRVRTPAWRDSVPRAPIEELVEAAA